MNTLDSMIIDEQELIVLMDRLLMLVVFTGAGLLYAHWCLAALSVG
jgi:hypothetical protein